MRALLYPSWRLSWKSKFASLRDSRPVRLTPCPRHGKLVASLNNQLATTLDLGTSHKAQISQAKEGQIQFQRKIDKLQMGISALEDQLADCQRVLSNKQKEISAVQNELEENRDAYEATQAEIVSLHARIANLETEVAQRDEADKGRAELQKQIDVRVWYGATAGGIHADDAGAAGQVGGV